MIPLPFPLALLLAAATVSAGLYDIRFRRIPNWLTVATLVAGFLGNLVVPEAPGLIASLAGFGLALLIYAPLYLLRAMGAGDVKLLAAIGAVVGPRTWFVVFLFSVVIGSLLGLVLLLTKGRLRRTFANIGSILSELAHLRVPYAKEPDLDVSSPSAAAMPHGAAVALGSLLYLVLTGPLGSI